MVVNPIYRQHLQAIKKELQKEPLPSVQLMDLFEKKEYAILRTKMEQLSFQREKKLQQYSYQKAEVPKNFFPKEFFIFIKGVLVKEPKSWTAYRLDWKDYRLLHDQLAEKPGTEVIIDLTKDWPGIAGGSVIYVDGEGNFYPLATRENTLSIIVRKKGFQKFFQYVNHYGKEQERLFIIGTVGTTPTRFK